MIDRRVVWAAVLSPVVMASLLHGASEKSFTIDAARSHATIEVGKSGVLSFAAGHPHEIAVQKVTGTVSVDLDDPAKSSVRVEIPADALHVTQKDESADDVPKIQETMSGAQVLDVQRYPKTTFASTSITVKSHTATSLDLVVSGRLTIRDAARAISVPVTVKIAGAALTAAGRFTVKQTDFGIKPVSVGGVVSVKDAIAIAFEISARGGA
jgi:polyisoprenoid-binding protein YceI